MLYLAGNNYLVSDQRLTDEDVDVLCVALSGNSYITALDLRYNNLTDAGIEHIAQLLLVRAHTVNRECKKYSRSKIRHINSNLYSP